MLCDREKSRKGMVWAYDDTRSARYAFSLAINGIVLGNVACALAKWEKVAWSVDPIFFFFRKRSARCGAKESCRSAPRARSLLGQREFWDEGS